MPDWSGVWGLIPPNLHVTDPWQSSDGIPRSAQLWPQSVKAVHAVAISSRIRLRWRPANRPPARRELHWLGAAPRSNPVAFHVGRRLSSRALASSSCGHVVFLGASRSRRAGRLPSRFPIRRVSACSALDPVGLKPSQTVRRSASRRAASFGILRARSFGFGPQAGQALQHPPRAVQLRLSNCDSG